MENNQVQELQYQWKIMWSVLIKVTSEILLHLEISVSDFMINLRKCYNIVKTMVLLVWVIQSKGTLSICQCVLAENISLTINSHWNDMLGWLSLEYFSMTIMGLKSWLVLKWNLLAIKGDVYKVLFGLFSAHLQRSKGKIVAITS